MRMEGNSGDVARSSLNRRLQAVKPSASNLQFSALPKESQSPTATGCRFYSCAEREGRRVAPQGDMDVAPPNAFCSTFSFGSADGPEGGFWSKDFLKKLSGRQRVCRPRSP